MAENEPENSPKKRVRTKKLKGTGQNQSKRIISHKPSMNRSPERYVDEDEEEEDLS